jgi:L-arabinokinase
MTQDSSVPAEALSALRGSANGWLARGRDAVVAAAPGRLDVMGGIADYSGAVVLEATIGDLAAVALQRRGDDLLRVRTTGPEANRLAVKEFTLHIGDLYQGAGRGRTHLQSYQHVHRLFPEEARWAAYVLGVFYALLAEGELGDLPSGADLLVHSTVPLGAGVASSAALEVAAMRAAGVAYGAPTSGLRLASLCQVVENRVVGAPCGIMDQVTCTLGQAGKLLALRCQPHDLLGWHAAPPGFTFVGLDSGVKHAVGGIRYPLVRCAAFMGRRIIQEAVQARGDDPSRAEYLCNLTPGEYRAQFRRLLPPRLSGHEFVERWGATDDAATTVDPAATYPVRGATEHPIYENARVLRFVSLLGQASDAMERTTDDGRRTEAAFVLRPSSVVQAAMRSAGRLMYGSHRSYSRNCRLGSRETDLLVSLVRQEGAARGLYGAKITGGGSGGTVAVMATAGPDGSLSAQAAAAIRRVREQYASATGCQPRLITGSAPGAEPLQPLRVRW